MTSKQLLCEGAAKGSRLEAYFSKGKFNYIDGKIFLDRDGKTFKELINFLRTECLIYPQFETEYDEKLFMAELAYWKI